MSIRTLIVDDHAVVRQGLKMFLGLDPDLELVGEAENGEEAVRLTGELNPDVILMDLLMPVMDGITAISTIRRDFPDIEIIALTSVLEDEAVMKAMRAGAIGYLLKDTQAEELRRAIKAAAAGQVQLSPQAAARLMREVRAPESPEKLTERETDVLRLLALGRANKEIALELTIGEKTVKTHVSAILRKLGVPSRTQAALHAVRIGLVSIEGENWFYVSHKAYQRQDHSGRHGFYRAIGIGHQPARSAWIQSGGASRRPTQRGQFADAELHHVHPTDRAGGTTLRS